MKKKLAAKKLLFVSIFTPVFLLFLISCGSGENLINEEPFNDNEFFVEAAEENVHSTGVFENVIEESDVEPPAGEYEAIHPLCIQNRCTSICEKLYVDGKYIPLCDIRPKYTFFFHDLPFRIDGLEMYFDGSVVANYHAEGTGPARSHTTSSDSLVGLFFIQNDRIVVDRGIEELTTTQWDDWGIQIFQFGGDVTRIGMKNTLSQMPELQEDDFTYRVFFCEVRPDGREMLYIFYHELPNSSLWQLLK